MTTKVLLPTFSDTRDSCSTIPIGFRAHNDEEGEVKERKRGASKGDRVETSFERGKSAQYDEVRGLLRKYLVHTREILNGKDFLFLGPRNVLHEALARIVDFEHGKKRFTYVDFAEIEEYFLLRVVGQETDQHHISGYFE